MDLRQARAIANKLEQAFDDVFLQGYKEPLTLVARKHNRIPRGPRVCKHDVVLRAKDVSAAIKDGYLTTGVRVASNGRMYPNRRTEPVQYLTLEYCRRCEEVQKAVAA